MTKAELENKIKALDIRIAVGQGRFRNYRKRAVRREKLLLDDVYKIMQEKLLLNDKYR